MEIGINHIGGILEIIDASYELSGKTAEIIFQGCNLKCPYCPKAVWERKYDSQHISLRNFTNKIKELREDGYENIVFGGAEPTFDKGIIALCYWLRNNMEFKRIKVKTNGLRPEILKEMPITDLELFIRSSFGGYRSKLKAPGSVSRRLLSSVEMCRLLGPRAAVVLDCHPEFLTIKDVNALIRELQGVEKIIVNQGTYKGVRYDPDELHKIRFLLLQSFDNVQVRLML